MTRGPTPRTHADAFAQTSPQYPPQDRPWPALCLVMQPPAGTQQEHRAFLCMHAGPLPVTGSQVGMRHAEAPGAPADAPC